MFETAFKIGVIVVVAFVIWRMTRPQFAIKIVMSPDGVLRHHGLAKAAVGQVLGFLEQQVRPTGRVTIYAQRQANGHLQLQVRGNVDSGTKQKIRNFFINVI